MEAEMVERIDKTEENIHMYRNDCLSTCEEAKIELNAQ